MCEHPQIWGWESINKGQVGKGSTIGGAAKEVNAGSFCFLSTLGGSDTANLLHFQSYSFNAVQLLIFLSIDFVIESSPPI